jgi:hypothetical protein
VTPAINEGEVDHRERQRRERPYGLGRPPRPRRGPRLPTGSPEQLVDRGILYDSGNLDAIRRMVAVAMLTQHDYDVEMWTGVIDDVRAHDTGGMAAT